MAKIRIQKSRCKGCQLCVIFCPKKNIKQDAAFNDAGVFAAAIISEDDCTGCGLCALMCPEACIEIEVNETK